MKKIILCWLLLIGTAHAETDGSLWGLVDAHSKTFQVEQEMVYSGGTDALFGYINEEASDGYKRDGLYGMYKLSHQVMPKLETSVAAGLYVHTTMFGGPADSTQPTTTYGASALAAVSIVYKLAERCRIQFRVEHEMFSSDGGPTNNLVLLGIGYTN